MLKWFRKKKDDTPENKVAEKPVQESPEQAGESKPKKAKTKKATAKKAKPKSAPKKSAPKSAEKPTETQPEKPKSTGGWLSRLVGGMAKSSQSIVTGITDVVTKKKLTEDTLQDLEDILIMADIGAKNSAQFVKNISQGRFDKEITDTEIRTALATEIATVLDPVAIPLTPNPTNTPHVILVVGVNGSGKTTTIGKLAQHYREQGKSVMLGAGDTFRAAAVEQLQVWGERTGCEVITKDMGSDAGALAYEAVAKAREQNTDILIIDTAGRLHNKDNLMAELEKVVRVIKKHDESYPHDTVMVLDATIGQNTVNQVTAFQESANVSGLVVTKLDGTAKGGIVVQLANQFALPIHAIGVGESADDLHPFNAHDYANSLMGLPPKNQ